MGRYGGGAAYECAGRYMAREAAARPLLEPNCPLNGV